MVAIVGDRVAVQAKSVHAPERMGTVQAVLAESPPRYQVRWDNGAWSIITSSALRVESGYEGADFGRGWRKMFEQKGAKAAKKIEVKSLELRGVLLVVGHLNTEV